MTFALHSPSPLPGHAGYLVSSVQHWEHFEYVRSWNLARHFETHAEATAVAANSRHAVAVISESEWRRLIDG